MEFHQTLVDDGRQMNGLGLEGQESKSQSQQGSDDWVILVGEGTHIDAWSSDYHLFYSRFYILTKVSLVI